MACRWELLDRCSQYEQAFDKVAAKRHTAIRSLRHAAIKDALTAFEDTKWPYLNEGYAPALFDVEAALGLGQHWPGVLQAGLSAVRS